MSQSFEGGGSFDATFERLVRVAGLPVSLQQLPPRERLIVIDARGRVTRVVDGAALLVELDWELELELHQPGANLVLVHNHPLSTGLSRADLEQLNKPGVAAVVAIGHDGSLYAATAGADSGDAMRQRLITAASNEIARQLRLARPVGRADGKRFDLHVTHLVSLALGSAGIIDYRAALAPARQHSYDQRQSFFIELTEAAARSIRESAGGLQAVSARCAPESLPSRFQ